MIIGFTGTHLGMAARQIKSVRQLLHNVQALHLGDCIGADAEAHAEAVRIGITTHGHPPTNSSRRAFCEYEVEYPAKPYLDRNLDIVKAGVDGLIAAPKGFVEPLSKRGQGTWTTIGYARQTGRHIWIVLPDGQIKEEQ